jgi:hypothetical protein
VILQVHECKNIKQYSEKGNLKDKNERTKVRNIKHKGSKEKPRGMQKEIEIETER